VSILLFYLLVCLFVHKITQNLCMDWDDIFRVSLCWANLEVIIFWDAIPLVRDPRRAKYHELMKNFIS